MEPWNFYDFPDIGNVIIPTDELIVFRGVQTTNQMGFHGNQWEIYHCPPLQSHCGEFTIRNFMEFEWKILRGKFIGLAQGPLLKSHCTMGWCFFLNHGISLLSIWRLLRMCNIYIYMIYIYHIYIIYIYHIYISYIYISYIYMIYIYIIYIYISYIYDIYHMIYISYIIYIYIIYIIYIYMIYIIYIFNNIWYIYIYTHLLIYSTNDMIHCSPSMTSLIVNDRSRLPCDQSYCRVQSDAPELANLVSRWNFCRGLWCIYL